MKKLYFLFLITPLYLFINGCNLNKSKKIVVINYLYSSVHDTIQSQTIQQLKNNNFDEKNGYEIIIKNADGNVESLSSVAEEVNNMNPVLVIGISSTVVQATIKKIKAPYVFSAVTDPVSIGALDSLNQIKPDITGVSGIAPFEKQLQLLKTIHPNLKTIGFIFNPNDPPARFAFINMAKIARKYKVEFLARPATNLIDLQEEALDLMKKVDVFLIASDNNAIRGFSHILTLCLENKKPLYASEMGSVAEGAIATVSTDYSEVGVQTGLVAVRVLQGKQNIPMQTTYSTITCINTEAAKLMKVNLPEVVVKEATLIFDKVK